MSYLLEKTTPDELLLMIAKESNDGKRPEFESIYGYPSSPGFCWLNMTDNLYKLRAGFYIVESHSQGFVVHLTNTGWDRVEELLKAGAKLPTEDEMKTYARHARVVVEGGDYEAIPLSVPNPRGIETRSKSERKRPNFLLRLFGVKSAT